jgi:uncharacterized coiled-coil protein SlyX
MESRIIELEKKITFLDHKLEELNEVIIHQSKVMDDLKNRLHDLSDQFQSGEPARKIEDEEPPPHY